jgi:3-oxoacyl-[acyl-carrier protein] reductase
MPKYGEKPRTSQMKGNAMPDKRLDGKVAVFTGGGHGPGRAIAEAFRAEGATVVCASGPQPPGQLFDRVDVSTVDSVRALIDRTCEAHGRVDILVANAGVSRDGTIVNPSADQWRASLDTNLAGTVYSISAAARHMRRQGGGQIITLSPRTAAGPASGAAGGAASTAGVETLTRVAAVDLGRHGIRVNCIAPGAPGGGRGAAAQPAPGELREAAHAAVFLAVPDSSRVNGVVLEVSGSVLGS